MWIFSVSGDGPMRAQGGFKTLTKRHVLGVKFLWWRLNVVTQAIEQIAVRGSPIGLELERVAEADFGFMPAPLVFQRDGQVVIGLSPLGCQCQRLTVAGLSLNKFALPVQGVTQVVVGICHVGVQGNGLSTINLRLGGKP